MWKYSVDWIEDSGRGSSMETGGSSARTSVSLPGDGAACHTWLLRSPEDHKALFRRLCAHIFVSRTNAAPKAGYKLLEGRHLSSSLLRLLCLDQCQPW